MKMLIVDDEEHVREGIELSIDWNSHGIYRLFVAENGLEALEIVRTQHPELIICDMSMHVMDGPTFLGKLREEGWTSKVIVLSGYQQFNYARATLLASGVDYLLKPFKIRDLDEAIHKACSQVRAERQKRLDELSVNQRLHEADQAAKEQRFASLIEGENASGEVLASFLASLGIDPEGFYTATFLPRNGDDLVRQYYNGDERLFNYALQNITGEMLGRYGNWCFIRYESFIIVLISADSEACDVQGKITQLQNAWRHTLRLATFVGLRNERISAAQLQSAMLEEKSIILSSNILHEGKPGERNAAYLNAFMAKELIILEAVRAKNIQQIKTIIRDFASELIAKQCVTIRELQHYTVEINLLLMRIYTQLKDDRLYETMPLWICELEEWSARLEQIFNEMIALIDYSKVELSHTHHVLAVRNYIHDHLKDDITLAGLAERFHFSPQYLAKRFKQEYNTTIIHYLNQQRMEKASSLLLHTDMSVQAIATESGFEELNYFSKVFRKYFGLSPTSYRKREAHH
ncbi:helix-turn-helix domain-containing protein [Paenibacillus sp. J5C_2022]|uniref:helix-turn-helix domain-containing protein n=1 Tax=Paenibacillus sp. J5C2022 TaxID=2977129 RepID=UPI0021CE5FA7|nr:helix-turn-helix domain-containing protein [Paenibacillus sp. J5C2022]MCU6711439.1 helix-turn-helix domain-containing protein [Paenibacillus sp. J5C2022]